jgi:hypothetical protein
VLNVVVSRVAKVTLSSVERSTREPPSCALPRKRNCSVNDEMPAVPGSTIGHSEARLAAIVLLLNGVTAE